MRKNVKTQKYYFFVFQKVHYSELSKSLGQLSQRLRPYTTFYNNSFLWCTKIAVNGQSTQVGVNEDGWLTLNCCQPQVSITFDSLIRHVDRILHSHGVHGVSQYWCEENPLFQLKVSSPRDLRKLLSLEKKIQKDLALVMSREMKALLQASNPDATCQFLVQVASEIYLLIPDNVIKDGKLLRINKKNVMAGMNLLAGSAVFDFGALFRAFRINPQLEDNGKFTKAQHTMHALS